MNISHEHRKGADVVLLVIGLAAAVSTIAVWLAYGLAACGVWVVVSSVAFWAVETSLLRGAARQIPVRRR